MRRLEIIVTGHGAGIDEARKASLDALDARLREYGIDPEQYDPWDKFEIAAGILDDKPGPLKLREILNRLEGRAAARQSQAVAAAQQDRHLTYTQQLVFDVILARGPIMGKGICKETGIEQSTLTRHIIPVLKAKMGVKNCPGSGYFFPDAT